jgi:hypothetical protein
MKPHFQYFIQHRYDLPEKGDALLPFKKKALVSEWDATHWKVAKNVCVRNKHQEGGSGKKRKMISNLQKC